MSLPSWNPLYLTWRLNDLNDLCHPQDFLEGLSVVTLPKVFPPELHFNSISKCFFWWVLDRKDYIPQCIRKNTVGKNMKMQARSLVSLHMD